MAGQIEAALIQNAETSEGVRYIPVSDPDIPLNESLRMGIESLRKAIRRTFP